MTIRKRQELEQYIDGALILPDHIPLTEAQSDDIARWFDGDVIGTAPKTKKISIVDAVCLYREKIMHGRRAKAETAAMIKSLWHVSWLATLLVDMDLLQQSLSAEADDANVDAIEQLTLALRGLGAALVGLTESEVEALLEDQPAETGEDPAMAARFSLLRGLAFADQAAIERANAALQDQPTGQRRALVA